MPAQIEQLQDMLDKARKQIPNRKLDLVLLTVGANDIKFSGLVADVIISAGVERTLFNQGGLLADRAAGAEPSSTATFPAASPSSAPR